MCGEVLQAEGEAYAEFTWVRGHSPMVGVARAGVDPSSVERGLYKTTDGWMYSWGGGDHGALGHGDELRQTLPKRLTCEEVVPDAFVGRSDAMETATLVKEERSG